MSHYHGSSVKILDAATATGAGASHAPWQAERTYQAHGTTSSGAGSAVVNIEVSNDNVNWVVAGTITLTLSTTSSTDGFTTNALWRYVRANVTTLSGTGASVTVWLGA